MASVIRSTLPTLLLNLQAQIMAVLGLQEARVYIDTEGEEFDDTHYQAEQVVFIRKMSHTPEPGFVGLGRVWAAERVRIAVTVYTRVALDAQPAYTIGMTDDTLGHETWMEAIRNALIAWQPLDVDNNWLVQEPLIPAGGDGPRRKRVLDISWAKSTLWFIMIFAPDVDQSYQ